MMAFTGLFTSGIYGGRWNIDFLFKEGDKILDLGGGTQTFPPSTDVLDKEEEESSGQRYGRSLDIGPRRLWNGYAEEILPTIPDNYFDFVYSAHTLEHVENLPFVLSEISRTCKRGFILVPHYYMDIWTNEELSYHTYLFAYSHKRNILKYRRRLSYEYYTELNRIQPPVLDWRSSLIQSHNDATNVRGLWEIRFYWEDQIDAEEDLDISEESKYKNEKFHI